MAGPMTPCVAGCQTVFAACQAAAEVHVSSPRKSAIAPFTLSTHPFWKDVSSESNQEGTILLGKLGSRSEGAQVLPSVTLRMPSSWGRTFELCCTLYINGDHPRTVGTSPSSLRTTSTHTYYRYAIQTLCPRPRPCRARRLPDGQRWSHRVRHLPNRLQRRRRRLLRGCRLHLWHRDCGPRCARRHRRVQRRAGDLFCSLRDGRPLRPDPVRNGVDAWRAWTGVFHERWKESVGDILSRNGRLSFVVCRLSSL